MTGTADPHETTPLPDPVAGPFVGFTNRPIEREPLLWDGDQA